MDTLDKKIAHSVQQEPSFDALSSLRTDVWEKVRATREKDGPPNWLDLTLSPGVKVFSLVLILGSCLALSQISFDKGGEPDLFDLRYFSHQSLTTTNLLSLNGQGTLP
ncbi:hypothetical protein [Desulforhopalus sp. 52FAK]